MLLQLENTGKFMVGHSKYYTYMHACVIWIDIGIKVHPHDVQSSFQMHTCASFDLPARASALNCIQFNEQYECRFCEQPGTSIQTDKGGNVWTFPYVVNSPKGPIRTHEAQIKHAKEAIQQKAVVY